MKLVNKLSVLLFLTLLYCCPLTLATTAKEAQWAKSVLRGDNISKLHAVTIDSEENIYAVGYWVGSSFLEFSNIATVSTSNTTDYNIPLIVKYDSSGEAAWARTLENSNNLSEFSSVVSDNNGNIYAAGFVTGAGPHNFGNGVSVSIAGSGAGTKNAVIVKYDSSGNAQWAKSVTTGPNDSIFYSITAHNNDIYVAGTINKSSVYDFGNGVTVSGSYAVGYNAVLLKYNNDGDAQWGNSVTDGTRYSQLDSVAVDANGKIYTAGFIFGTSDYNFGNGATCRGTSATENVVVVKYDSNGDAEWARSVSYDSTGSHSAFSSITIDNSNNVYAVGYIHGPPNPSDKFNFGNGVTIRGSNMFYNVVIVKYDTDGKAQWARSTISGTWESKFSSVATNNGNDIYAAGYITNTYPMGFDNSITVRGTDSGKNILLVNFGSDGTVLWAKSTASGSEPTLLTSVVVNDNTDIYTAGAIFGTSSVGFGNKVTTHGILNTDTSPSVVLIQYSDATTASENNENNTNWWDTNKAYIFIGIGSTVAAGAAVTIYGYCLCSVCVTGVTAGTGLANSIGLLSTATTIAGAVFSYVHKTGTAIESYELPQTIIEH